MAILKSHGRIRAKALANSGAWLLILIGLVLFSINIPMESLGWVNLPVALTIFQTAGAVFMLCGFSMIASMVIWPQLNASQLLAQAMSGNVAAGLIILGLLLFNAIVILAFALWLSGALGAGVTAK